MNFNLPKSDQNKHTRLALRSVAKKKVIQLSDFNYSKDNVDCPLKKMQAVLKVVTGLDLMSLERELVLASYGQRSVPMVFHNSKISHHSKVMLNNRGLTGGPACYPKKCVRILLEVIKYLKSMHRELLLGESKTLLFFKEATATKGITIKRGNIRAMGVTTLKKRQKVHLKFRMGKYRVENDE